MFAWMNSININLLSTTTSWDHMMIAYPVGLSPPIGKVFLILLGVLAEIMSFLLPCFGCGMIVDMDCLYNGWFGGLPLSGGFHFWTSSPFCWLSFNMIRLEYRHYKRDLWSSVYGQMCCVYQAKCSLVGIKFSDRARVLLNITTANILLTLHTKINS